MTVFWCFDRLNESNNPWVDCALFRQYYMHLRYKASYAPVLPGFNFVLVPWASTRHNWRSFMQSTLAARAKEVNVSLWEQGEAACSFLVSCVFIVALILLCYVY